MIGSDAFCPKTGAPLSERRHYDATGQPYRAVTSDERAIATPTEGELTNGAVRSSSSALLRYFRRCHRRHHDDDEALYRQASIAVRRLKNAATGRQEWDVHVWYALERRLARTGHENWWMHSHAEPRCPRCHGRLSYTKRVDGVGARCGTNCDGRQVDRLTTVRATVADLYAQAFPDDGDGVSTEDVLQF